VLGEDTLSLQREHAQTEAHMEGRRHELAPQTEQLGAQIDAFVYRLYGLTAEKTGIIEGEKR